MFAWFDQHKARLSYLKKSHLEDPTLYDDGCGQEKRNFISHLLLKITKQKVDPKVTFRKIYASYKKLSKAQQIKWLSQVLELSE